ncbi:G-type lectin S-receptor-like serine/threonine-protein kinase At4g27290 isoform X1 [Ananas comosus]|uniref:Receptor-like serine/threonine-protein kinase n=1 Tax=Ananas comosus TaxID=4615 RepID=A0A6P5FDX9_ANACO|nr:G-type lectin S-receptor-like serine/threonine-protein kinase At4g27290 isoform X1 [Ananas comosus]XP_020091501.1 G-type lectin S-receptor-like serine/threonine-protein kinase At4g27290 isoform X1 [Ananas comosus]XP_020091502.1 G-type lectin S-receptor-like serine/threonine-protein kinase At4g27290 isoform X1 [Ananas comosus]XP_020091503.1 G-type lectin S-receptor-like serine/threonine-protein kinase At4g27290 isoform X1 [Ananas comosus]XP_020091505.1 G-type lectin S-receptor-like serine/thr
MSAKRSTRNSLVLPLIFLSPFLFHYSYGSDSLFPGQSIRDGETLISAHGIYELGFFSPGDSTKRYVGIWYHKLPILTVVWVGNRENPISDSSGYITMDEQGNLKIMDGKGTSFLLGANNRSTNITSATLLDSGNLVLREMSSSGNDIVWQSFDHPTDNQLPGMKLTLSTSSISWRSTSDPRPGNFSFGIDPNGTDQLFLWNRTEVIWSVAVLNGVNFSLVQDATVTLPGDLDGYTFIHHWGSGYYYYTLADSSIITRGFTDHEGRHKQLAWLDGEENWVTFLVKPNEHPCEVPSSCGVNGLCSNDSSVMCTCLFGFEPNVNKHWDSRDYSDGCIRKVQSECMSNGDGFLKLRNIKLPIFSSKDRNLSLGIDDCKAWCTKNCSCNAYTSAYLNRTGCSFWFGDLYGLQAGADEVQDLFVRLAASELKKHSGNLKSCELALINIGIALCILGAFLCGCKWRKAKVRHRKEENDFDCSSCSFATIAACTNQFSDVNKIGEGGFGPVYKGFLEGQSVAVKRLSSSSGQGLEEFANEITLIAKLQHRNLVRLLGYCIQKEEKILIYEYMPNKSLDYYIFDSTKGAELDWEKRFHIVEGIAQGLLYLHNYSRLKVIHWDLKSSNILLDSEMNPKISDFGLARTFGQNENQANTKRVMGTYGYMSPEYAMNGLFSVKSDVFSFGVILLEIITGLRSTDYCHQDGSENLLAHSWELWREGRCSELANPTIGDMHPFDEVQTCIQVALLCVQDIAADRPTMSDVVSMLRCEISSLPIPKKPAFLPARSVGREDFRKHEIHSLNNLTMSIIECR